MSVTPHTFGQVVRVMPALVMLAWSGLMQGQAPQPDGGGVETGTLPKAWPTGGPRCMEQPEWHVHEYNEDFYILRESGCVHYEKPFLYLIFGNDTAMLMDTGAGKTDVAPFVDKLVAKWLARKKRSGGIKLMVMHSHGHGDHIAGDSQFKNRPGIDFVPADIPAVQKEFGIGNWPEDVGRIDLGGGRLLDVIPIPGHDPGSIAVYDRRTAVLLTGDSLYPGRLYIRDWDAFVKSTRRLVHFTQGRIVSHILGCHIEQTGTPYLEFPIGSIFQPNEHILELARGQLLELNEALIALEGVPTRVALRDFTIYPTSDKVWQELRQKSREVESEQRKRQWAQPIGRE